MARNRDDKEASIASSHASLAIRFAFMRDPRLLLRSWFSDGARYGTHTVTGERGGAGAREEAFEFIGCNLVRHTLKRQRHVEEGSPATQ